MGVVCPTVTAYSAEDFAEQLSVVVSFAERIHIDMGDGQFTKKMVGVSDMKIPDGITVDFHVMYQKTYEVVNQLIPLNPHLIILHAEAVDIVQSIEHVRAAGINVGIALLQKTTVESMRPAILRSDHVLIFSGSLGSYGGVVDYSLLQRVREIRAINPAVEIGWDGGVNEDTIRRLFEGGIDVLNVGGAIHNANYPENAFRSLVNRAFN